MGIRPTNGSPSTGRIPFFAYWITYALRVPLLTLGPLLCIVSDQNATTDPARTGTNIP